MMHVSLPAVLCLALTLPLGCGEYVPPGGLDTIRMTIGNRTFTLEVADDEDSRTYGLMRRDSIPRDHGMIFVFPDERRRSFWMHNVRFPLDIIFLDAEGKIVSIHQMQAYDRTATWSDGPARYAIELNKDMAAAAGVQAGDVLTIPDRAREPAR